MSHPVNTVCEFTSLWSSLINHVHPMTNRVWVTHFLSMPGNLINCILSHDQQYVGVTVSFLCRQSPQSCLIHWPTECERHCFIALPAVSSIMSYPNDDQKEVSHNALWLSQAVSSIASHPMTNRMSVMLCYCFANILINNVSSYGQQGVSDSALSLSQVVSSIVPHCPMNNRLWVTLLYSRHSHQSYFIPLLLLYFFSHNLTIPWPNRL